jgi:alanine dehydrogenase
MPDTDLLSLGVLATSQKENELRLPIHPAHLGRIDEDLRARIVLEQGYGGHFGARDEVLREQVAVASRAEILRTCDVILLPKPTIPEVRHLREGQVLWGWPHCVQDRFLTQIAIDQRLTLIAWEAMNYWRRDGSFVVHVFHLNNEIAGYASVMQAMALAGFTGHYGRKRRAVVLGFGNTARGAVLALQSLGALEVVVLTMRDVHAVAYQMQSTILGGMQRDEDDPTRVIVQKSGGPVPAHEFLAEFDIVVNCVMQDTDAPMMFVSGSDIDEFEPGSLIVDVSCDAGMGFDFARPTTFEDPMFTVGDGVHYYAVDHSPSYLWESATWENSQALIPFIRPVLEGTKGWDGDRTISRAIEIRDGVVRNPKILSFQDRAEEYPHRVRGS